MWLNAKMMSGQYTSVGSGRPAETADRYGFSQGVFICTYSAPCPLLPRREPAKIASRCSQLPAGYGISFVVGVGLETHVREQPRIMSGFLAFALAGPDFLTVPTRYAFERYPLVTQNF